MRKDLFMILLPMIAFKGESKQAEVAKDTYSGITTKYNRLKILN